MVSKYSEAVRQLRESELKCQNPDCGAENVAGDGGTHITLDEFGYAVCHVCGTDWRPDDVVLRGSQRGSI